MYSYILYHNITSSHEVMTVTAVGIQGMLDMPVVVDTGQVASVVGNRKRHRDCILVAQVVNNNQQVEPLGRVCYCIQVPDMEDYL